ncbi:hypothetical protein BAOM_4268 [Peribacillus asahii]|uniref:GIY-YIG domain-containing protein n=1 Tax=Peribacillus asahii TaxID=228899 RepID=A0A3T0KX01_9BACI|nr:hypothetical protein [Peribacillus asahii]AZV44849.1 hypothetical protein BAOM_4268 [Peribacillus asahii]
MVKREYTHVDGFNYTSLIGLSGIYIFQELYGNLVYIGMWYNDDFRSRMRKHGSDVDSKYDSNIHYIHVIIVDQNIYPILPLEHLYIWYFNLTDQQLLFYKWDDNEEVVKQKAKEQNLDIGDSIKDFLLTFECVLLEKEWGEDSAAKRYGEVEKLSSKKYQCDGSIKCRCYRCLLNRRKN